MPVFRSYRRLRALMAIAMALQMLFVQAMAADAALHKCCHDHAHEPDHQCVVTLILSGGYDISVPDIVPVTVATEPPDVTPDAPEGTTIQPSHLIGGVLAHAPPRGP